MESVHNIAKKVAEGYAIRLEQQIMVCIKPKPAFISNKIWLKLASIFIYIEKTQPSITIKEN